MSFSKYTMNLRILLQLEIGDFNYNLLGNTDS
jgi:hypothetical protein